MKTKPLSSACLAALAIISWSAGNISAQSQFGDRFSSTIQLIVSGDTNNSRQRTSHWGIMDPIGLYPNEQVVLNLILPSDRVNYPVGVAPLDGGEISVAANLSVASNGTVSFGFKGGDTPGLYRILVTIASEQYELQLYVPPPGAVPDGCGGTP